jgi:hypothetical protein
MTSRYSSTKTDRILTTKLLQFLPHPHSCDDADRYTKDYELFDHFLKCVRHSMNTVDDNNNTILETFISNVALDRNYNNMYCSGDQSYCLRELIAHFIYYGYDIEHKNDYNIDMLTLVKAFRMKPIVEYLTVFIHNELPKYKAYHLLKSENGNDALLEYLKNDLYRYYSIDLL